MKVMLTGGTGFIGGHLLRALTSAGHDVRLLVHHDDRRSPQARAQIVAQVVKVHDRIAHVFTAHTRNRGATGDHSQQIVPAATDATAVFLD